MKCFGAVTALLMYVALSSLDARSIPLFVIERNKNANVVSYDVNIGSDGRIDAKKPFNAYWILLAKDGQKAALSLFDKKAYGFHYRVDKGKNLYRLIIDSFTKREIDVYQDGAKIRSVIAILGKPAYLEKIYVTANQSFPLPIVKSIEIFGKDIRTGAKLYEKIPV